MMTTSNTDTLKDHIHQMAERAGMLWFFDNHLLLVEKWAKWLLSRLPEADGTVVMAAVWLHDIYYFIDLEREKEHAQLGALEAEKILKDRGFDATVIADVSHAIRAHSCRDIMPETVEAKIFASADAMSHFSPQFYFSLAMYGQKGSGANKNLKEFLEFARGKLEKDMNGGKIFFDFAREAVRADYEKCKSFFEMGAEG